MRQKVMVQAERRNGLRRKLVLPVVFYCPGGRKSNCRRFTGRICDVGDGSMRIEFQFAPDQSIGNKLVVFVPYPEGSDQEDSGMMVEITGEIAWLDRATSRLGLRYM
jgi:hypothetical protein